MRSSNAKEPTEHLLHCAVGLSRQRYYSRNEAICVQYISLP